MAQYNYNNVASTSVVNNGSTLRQGDVLLFNTTGQWENGTPIRWKVPYEGKYSIEVRGGASGIGDMSSGSRVQFQACQVTIQNVYLPKNTELVMVIGQRSRDQSSTDMPVGGGGGTFVTKIVGSGGETFEPLNVQVVPIVVAGGAPGMEDDPAHDKGTWFHNQQVTSFGNSGGTYGSAQYCGGGFRGNRYDNTCGFSFLKGAQGSIAGGGYGGGGGCSDPIGGGGGGWTGGLGGSFTCESGASYWLPNHTYTTAKASLSPNSGTVKITYSSVIDISTSHKISKSGDKISLSGIPARTTTKWEIDVYLNGVKKKTLKGNGNIPSSHTLMTMEEYKGDYAYGNNNIRAVCRVAVNTSLVQWFDFTGNVNVDARYPVVDWDDYSSTYIAKESILTNPFTVRNCNIPYTESTVEVLQGGQLISSFTIEGKASAPIDLQGCVEGNAQLKITVKVKAGSADGYGYDISNTHTKDIFIQDIKPLNIVLRAPTYQYGDIINFQWTPQYAGTYQYLVHDEDNLEGEYQNCTTSYQQDAVIPSIYSDKALVSVRCVGEKVTYKPQSSETFNITDMDWQTTNVNVPNIDYTVSGSTQHIRVLINGVERKVFNGGSTNNYALPISYFTKGVNTISVECVDTKNGSIYHSQKVNIDYMDENLSMGDIVSVQSYHCFLHDGVQDETYTQGNNTNSSSITLGVAEKEFVHHTPDSPSSNVVQKIVINRSTLEDTAYDPIKITGAIE